MKRILIAAMTFSLLSTGIALADAKKACPPGLAKKSADCLPPGQIKKVYGYYKRGDSLSGQDYHSVIYPNRYNLPPLPVGERYVIVNNQIMVMQENNSRILDIVRAVQAILD